jgi:hypothetical protein
MVLQVFPWTCPRKFFHASVISWWQRTGTFWQSHNQWNNFDHQVVLSIMLESLSAENKQYRSILWTKTVLPYLGLFQAEILREVSGC